MWTRYLVTAVLALAPASLLAEPMTAPAQPPTRASVRVVSGGSAVMITTDPGGKYEMVTISHRDDGGALMATHCCAPQNQPRMKATAPADPSRIAFEFVDGTNLAAYPGRMQRLVILAPGPDRQVQEWTYREAGKDSTDVFDMKRVK